LLRGYYNLGGDNNFKRCRRLQRHNQYLRACSIFDNKLRAAITRSCVLRNGERVNISKMAGLSINNRRVRGSIKCVLGAIASAYGSSK
jgi:hypothetical protein